MAKRTFREALIFYRDQYGLTQNGMADMLSLKLRYYQKLEGGESEEPSILTLSKVLEGLGITFEEFFDRPVPSVAKPAIRPQEEPGWIELSHLFQYYGDAEFDERLLGLYILSENPGYLEQYAAIDSQHAAGAVALKRILATS